MGPPAVKVNQVGKILASLPALLFQFRLRMKFGKVADAQIRHRRKRGWDSKRGLQLFKVEDADPSDAERLRARREPKILHRANGRIEIDRRVGLAAQSTALAAPVIAGDANVDRRLQNARQFQAVVKLPLRAFIEFRGAGAGALEIPVHGLADGSLSNHYKIPGLHEADRGRMVRCVQNPAEHLAGYGLRQKMRADVATLVDGAID